MRIKAGEQENYEKGLANNTDAYGGRVYSYAKDWAELLEKRIPEGAGETVVAQIIADHADEDSHTADTDGITGFMYGAAVSTLGWFWEYGEQLRRWSNLKLQIHNEGEEANKTGGTLNPALLRIAK